MLTIQIVNKGEAQGLHSYSYEVYVNDERIAGGNCEHNPADGWAVLLMDIAIRNLNEQAMQKISCPHCSDLMSNHVISDAGGFCEPYQIPPRSFACAKCGHLAIDEFCCGCDTPTRPIA
jgi:hypothetical protein